MTWARGGCWETEYEDEAYDEDYNADCGADSVMCLEFEEDEECADQHQDYGDDGGSEDSKTDEREGDCRCAYDRYYDGGMVHVGEDGEGAEEKQDTIQVGVA